MASLSGSRRQLHTLLPPLQAQGNTLTDCVAAFHRLRKAHSYAVSRVLRSLRCSCVQLVRPHSAGCWRETEALQCMDSSESISTQEGEIIPSGTQMDRDRVLKAESWDTGVPLTEVATEPQQCPLLCGSVGVTMCSFSAEGTEVGCNDRWRSAEFPLDTYFQLHSLLSMRKVGDLWSVVDWSSSCARGYREWGHFPAIPLIEPLHT